MFFWRKKWNELDTVVRGFGGSDGTKFEDCVEFVIFWGRNDFIHDSFVILHGFASRKPKDMVFHRKTNRYEELTAI